jgi:NO-binding membrane sensor protein with MHYT domain
LFRILDCLTTQHDWRLVAVAGVVCFLASLTAITLFHRARSTKGRARTVWLAAAGAATVRHLGDTLSGDAGLPARNAGRL